MIGADGITDRRTDAVLSGSFRIVAPEACFHLVMQKCGAGFGESIGEGLDQESIVVIVLLLEFCRPFGDPVTGRDGKESDMIILISHEICQ